MASQSAENQPGLRDFIREYGARVFTFCDYLLPKEAKPEETLVRVFREFGNVYRKANRKQPVGWQELEMRVKLFSIAWQSIREAMGEFHFLWIPGRDTRAGRRVDENLLAQVVSQPFPKTERDTELVNRLKCLDPEFRAPVVLRDILRLEEEEILRVLGLRWGVYRHRLHRGRIEFKDGLKGPLVSSAGERQPTL